ncbi:MAG: hypothetical protein A3D27_03035 [Omnitrophica WOR_2 bacterium RIFCSPHIGHO2_02_FULL_46_37]|nr:MAG: hypothetical protein A3D27_03035 [Omnitrophica WOR_2 bacterium RIFCSPHIGHO2_02_FULL_46_37]
MENTKSSSSGSVPAGSVGVDKTSLVPDTSAGAGELESIETQGKTPAEAIEKALAILRVDRSKVKVKILSEEQKGLFGMEGARPAKVRVTLLKKKKT